MTATMTDEEFRLFRNLIHGASGLFFPDSKKAFVSSRIEKRLAARSIPSFYRYYRFLEDGEAGREELLRLLDLLTINETGFFRNRPQFRLFETHVLPEVIEARRRSKEKTLRLWSAGCSTGEEPYSIAISVLERLGPATDWKVQIFASDLSLSALDRAARGEYSAERVEGIDPERRRRYFEPCGAGFAVREEVKRLVIYDFHNLKHDNGLRELDVIFCRNVMIYFDRDEQDRLVDKFVRALRPGGYLFVGHAETLQGRRAELEFVHRDKGSAYRKREAP